MAQSQIGTLAGFDWIDAANALSGATLYLALTTGSLDAVGGGTVTHSSALGSDVTECSGTGYARKSFTMGTSSNGVMVVPSVNWTNTTNAWSSNVNGLALMTAASAGTTLFIWDFTAVRDMSVLNSTLSVASFNFFLENPGGA